MIYDIFVSGDVNPHQTDVVQELKRIKLTFIICFGLTAVLVLVLLGIFLYKKMK